LNWFGSTQEYTPASWDLADILWLSSVTSGPYLDKLLTGDIFTYGPRGSNEYLFGYPEYIPDEYIGGQLAESWEVSPERIVYQIRPGIMWHESPIMESRELTADDIVHSLRRFVAAMKPLWPVRVAMIDDIDDIYAQGKYTVVVETNSYEPNWEFYIAWGFQTGIQPPELVEAGAADWRNHVGIGTNAFLLTNYVDGVAAMYVPNPDWWDKKKTINGKEYDTPFIDKLVYPFIKDESTKIAALRTGKIDFMSEIPLRYEDTLKQTCPNLIV
ncbi:unnamed protein product, partial [marine sediment metagenome]